MDQTDVYQQKGYANRAAYLRGLADEMGLSLACVRTTAELLGPSEDFDGLVTTLEDLDGADPFEE